MLFRSQDASFSAGLLHDIGRIIIAVRMPEQMTAITAEAANRNLPQFVVEQERLGFSHAEVGGYLLGLWGLPFSIVEAVAFHHEPERCTELGAVALSVHQADRDVDRGCWAAIEERNEYVGGR